MPFRKDFIWGVATAAYQIEGGYNEDGKGRSVWDDYCMQADKVANGDSGAVACDHYHRFREDIKLMAELGVKNYRFSISWPRVLPHGTGTPNEAGLRYYDELLDTLIENDIKPYITLFHWDYPSELHHRGGWMNPDSPRWFESYVELIAKRFGDRAKDFFTFNEPQCFIGLGYTAGVMAPGWQCAPCDAIPMSFHVHQAHGLAVKKLRELVSDVKIGFVGCGSTPMAASDSPEDIDAARKAFFGTFEEQPTQWAWNNAWWNDPIMLGAYPADALSVYGKYLPQDFEKSYSLICQPLDYYGQNVYEGYRVRADARSATGFERLPSPTGMARTGCHWPVTPDVLYWTAKLLYERYHVPFLITENGMSGLDTVSLDGKVHDPDRIDYMHRYLLGLRRAVEEGVDVRGYFAWSLLDNFEWARGYSERFGLVYVDYATQKRIVKDSALWYREVMRTNGGEL